MKHKGVVTGIIAAGLLAAAGTARSQVEVKVVMEQTQFLTGEATPVAVQVVNHSGQTLHFGPEDWLSFNVEGAGGFVVSKLGDPPLGHNFDVKTGDVATQHADLAPYYMFSKTGHFTLTATVRLTNWGAEVSSAPKGLDVIQGVKLSELEFGVPEAPGSNNGPPEVRKYVLQKATYLAHLRLYLRVTDQTGGRTYRVFAVGPMVSFSNPQMRLDRHNNLHLVYESGARIYNYTVVNPDGDLLARQTYDYLEGAPRLKTDDSGAVGVAGGRRHLAGDDVPPSGVSTNTAGEPPVKR